MGGGNWRRTKGLVGVSVWSNKLRMFVEVYVRSKAVTLKLKLSEKEWRNCLTDVYR